MATTLIVANQTLPSAALADEIAQRIASGSTVFYVVVPATPPPGRFGFTWDEDAARAEAETRLNAFLERLRNQGATAEGEIGDRDPVAAVRDARRNRDVSEVILSTFPTGISRWLRQDVPSRMRGAFTTPVTVVGEQPTATSSSLPA